MKDYKLKIINGAFVASGLAVQAKGLLYRLRADKKATGDSRGKQKVEDYQLGTLGGMHTDLAGSEGLDQINKWEDEYSGSSDYWLGRSVLTDVTLVIPGEGTLLMNDVTLSVSLQKEIVRTSLVGRAGTIKEYITDGDYQVSMSVGLVAVNDYGEIIDQYPERAVEQLRSILERPESLEVVSTYLGLFGITHIVVTGFTAKQMTHSNRQVIDITAVSDTEYVIESNDY